MGAAAGCWCCYDCGFWGTQGSEQGLPLPHPGIWGYRGCRGSWAGAGFLSLDAGPGRPALRTWPPLPALAGTRTQPPSAGRHPRLGLQTRVGYEGNSIGLFSSLTLNSPKRHLVRVRQTMAPPKSHSKPLGRPSTARSTGRMRGPDAPMPGGPCPTTAASPGDQSLFPVRSGGLRARTLHPTGSQARPTPARERSGPRSQVDGEAGQPARQPAASSPP